MNKPESLKKGDKVAIVSLSNGMLGEAFCSHNIAIGVRRLKEFGLEPVFMTNTLKGMDYLDKHPEKRAEDLKEAFLDDTIKGIICAIGGEDTYRLLPYLMEDREFREAVLNHPKIFTGYSDSTINHLMLYQLGLKTFYGPCFICDLAEISKDMLPYTKKSFLSFMEDSENREITSSDVWYEERSDFSEAAIGTERISHKESRGFELLQGADVFSGQLLGGCLETIYDAVSGRKFAEEKEICEKYQLVPAAEEWKNKILFIETCEEKPTPEDFKVELLSLKERGIFTQISGIIVGKPMEETYYEEYKKVLVEVVDNTKLPILYNVNFGHTAPICVLPYGAEVKVDAKKQTIQIMESVFEN